MNQFVKRIFAYLSHKVLVKYKPTIIAITGSVGKTSTREAVYAVVSQKFFARKAEKNFNDQIGLPLAIVGISTHPGVGVIERTQIVLRFVFRAIKLLAFKVRFPEILVLEMGIDKPGEMDKLLAIAPPRIGVLTNIGFSHHEFFEDIETIEREKGKLISALPADGFAIVNSDDPRVVAQVKSVIAKVLTYGSGSADYVPKNVSEILTGRVTTSFELDTPKGVIPLEVKAIGSTHISACVVAVAVGQALKIEADLIEKGVAHYKPFPGRLNMIGAIKHGTLIDDTYNASPDSMREALSVLARSQAAYKMAVLGDMLELGSISDAAHLDIGGIVASVKPTHLITVGPNARLIAQGAKEAGFSESQIISFDFADEAKKTVQELLEPEGVILLKGSQSMRLEKIAKEIMAEPMRAHELLCRQYGKWLKD